MSLFDDFDPDDPDNDVDDLDEEDLAAFAEMTDEDLADLVEDPGPCNPLAGYARPVTRRPKAIAPYRRVEDLHPL